MALLMALVVSWLVWGPLGIMCYMGGLFNCMGVFMVLFVMMLPALVFAAAFPVLVVLAAVTWRRRALAGRRRITFWVVLTGGFVVPYVLGIVGLGASPFDMFVRGFTRYAGCRVDVAAIQSWLGGLDPNDITSDGGGIGRQLAESEQPRCISRLAPRIVSVETDGRRRSVVRLCWGSGFIGSWGVVIGHEDMPTPPSDLSDHGEIRCPLAPGVYVWYSE